MVKAIDLQSIVLWQCMFESCWLPVNTHCELYIFKVINYVEYYWTFLIFTILLNRFHLNIKISNIVVMAEWLRSIVLCLGMFECCQLRVNTHFCLHILKLTNYVKYSWKFKSWTKNTKFWLHNKSWPSGYTIDLKSIRLCCAAFNPTDWEL